MHDDYLDKCEGKGAFPWAEKGWEIELVKDAPKQTNVLDCGVFVVMYTYALATGRPYTTYQQADVPAFRKWLGLSLLNGFVPYRV